MGYASCDNAYEERRRKGGCLVMASKTDKLRYMSIVMKAFSVASYVMQWYGEAAQDEVIDEKEVTSLGIGICDILGVRINIEVPKP